MSSVADQLQDRADGFSARLVRYLHGLKRDPVIDTIVRQLARAGTAVAANYRATRRARSRAEFIARLAVVVEEADESAHWIWQIENVVPGCSEELTWLADEVRQLRAIFSRSLATARSNYAAEKLSAPLQKPRRK